MRTLITGANGFIGKALCNAFIEKGYSVRGTFRSKEKIPASPEMECVAVGDIGPKTSWEEALIGIDRVVHLAARVHILRDSDVNPLDAYRYVNTEGTRRLAVAAVRSGVRRLIYLSTVKVNGEETGEKPFTEMDPTRPQDPYAISKLEAEEVLQETARKTGLEVVIIRPPLVYGPGVRANFLRLMRWIDRGVPLPFGGIDNQRSMVYIGNLIDALMTCVSHEKAAGETFLVSDGKEFSTLEWMRMIAEAMGKKTRQLSVPGRLLKVLGRITGQSEEIKRLTGSLVIDINKIRNLLEWRPPFTVQDGIKDTVRWYQSL